MTKPAPKGDASDIPETNSDSRNHCKHFLNVQVSRDQGAAPITKERAISEIKLRACALSSN